MGSRGASAALNASQASVSMGAAGNNARKEEIRGRIDEINTVLNDYSLTGKERTRLEKEQDGLYEELGFMKAEEKGYPTKKTMPKGWKVLEGATTAPNGMTWVYNGKGRFGGGFEQALVPTSKVRK